MKGEFYKAPGRLRHELKKEFEPLVEGRLLSEGPDDIVRNNWHKLLQKFEEVIQREKNRIQQRLNEIQQKLGDIKLEDIEKSLEKIRKKQRELKEELRRSEEALENILGKGELIREAGEIEFKKMKLEQELERLEKDYIQGGSMSEVEKIEKKQRELREELKGLEEDLKNIERSKEYNSELAFRFIKEYLLINENIIVGDFIDGFIRYLIGEDKYRLVEPYLKKLKERTKLRREEKELELKRENLLENLPKKEALLEELKKIKLIEAQSEDKIREFIKDLIGEMRKEKEMIFYESKLYDPEDLFRYGDDLKS